MIRRIFVDGVEDARLPADDPGILRGLTVFESFRTYGRAPFRLDAHLDRLAASARVLEIDMPPRSLLEAEIDAVLAVDVAIRILLTGGGRRVMLVDPVDLDRIGRPVATAVMPWSPPALLPGAVKHASRAAWVIAARRLGAEEVLLVDPAGNILESNRSNVFAVIDGRLRTPPLDGRALEGVTRAALLEAAARAGLEVDEVPIRLRSDHQELWLSSTLKELAPVATIDDQPAAGAGALGRRLHQAFHELVKHEIGCQD